LKIFLKPKYFDKGRKLWTAADLPACQSIAEALRVERHEFKVLDVAQLLKHMLALASNFGHQWSLCCLWFEVPGPLADKHRQELSDFAVRVANEGKFLALTYQELFIRMVPCLRQMDSEYVTYLQDRYMHS